MALNQEGVGSIPTPELRRTEVIRPDEEPVLKTGGGGAACEFESHGFRLTRGLMVQQEDTGLTRRTIPDESTS